MSRITAIIMVGVLLAGCTITVTGGGGQGRLLVYVENIPAAAVRLSYVVESRAGLGHHRSGSRNITRDDMALEFNSVVEGNWTIMVKGLDRNGRTVFERHTSTFIRADDLRVVTIRIGGGPPPRR